MGLNDYHYKTDIDADLYDAFRSAYPELDLDHILNAVLACFTHGRFTEKDLVEWETFDSVSSSPLLPAYFTHAKLEVNDDRNTII